MKITDDFLVDIGAYGHETSSDLIPNLEQLSLVSSEDSQASNVASAHLPAPQGSLRTGLSHSSWNSPEVGNNAVTTHGASGHHVCLAQVKACGLPASLLLCFPLNIPEFLLASTLKAPHL